MVAFQVRIKGSPRYHACLKHLAARQGTTISDLIRQALDVVHGEELKRIDAYFFADNVAQVQHNMATVNDIVAHTEAEPTS